MTIFFFFSELHVGFFFPFKKKKLFLFLIVKLFEF